VLYKLTFFSLVFFNFHSQKYTIRDFSREFAVMRRLTNTTFKKLFPLISFAYIFKSVFKTQFYNSGRVSLVASSQPISNNILSGRSLSRPIDCM